MFIVTVRPIVRLLVVWFMVSFGQDFIRHASEPSDQVIGGICLFVAVLIIFDTAHWMWAWVKAYVAGPERF